MIRCCEAIGAGLIVGLFLAAIIFRVGEQFDARLADY